MPIVGSFNLVPTTTRIRDGHYEMGSDAIGWTKIMPVGPHGAAIAPGTQAPSAAAIEQEGRSDPFSEAVREAQSKADLKAQAYVPDRFANNPDFDTSKAYDAVMGRA